MRNQWRKWETYQKELQELTIPRKEGCAAGSDLESRRRRMVTGGSPGSDLQSESRRREHFKEGFCCCRSYYDITMCPLKDEVSGPWKRVSSAWMAPVDGELRKKVYCCKRQVWCDNGGDAGEAYQKELVEVRGHTRGPGKDECSPGSDL